MSNLSAAIQVLEDAIEQEQPFETVMQTLRSVFAAGAAATNDERNAALVSLADLILQTDNDMLAGYISIACGAFVEQGADPLIAADVMLNRLEEIVEGAAEYYAACVKANAFDEGADAEMIKQTVAEQMPLQAFQWAALEQMYIAPIALLSRSKTLRQRTLSRQQLKEHIRQMSHDNAGANWLNQMLLVLDDEMLLVLHPEQKKGYRVRIEGIASNFDLHTLLAAALIGDLSEGWLEGKAPDPDVVEALQGRAPAEAPQMTGVFNLVNYTGLQKDLTVSKELDADGRWRSNWIWNEGTPADIIPFEGLRVILLTDPPYTRVWNAQRIFDGMIGRLYVDEILSQEQVQAWLRRLQGS
jgi:hypothetical protein